MHEYIRLSLPCSSSVVAYQNTAASGKVDQNDDADFLTSSGLCVFDCPPWLMSDFTMFYKIVA